MQIVWTFPVRLNWFRASGFVQKTGYRARNIVFYLNIWVCFKDTNPRNIIIIIDSLLSSSAGHRVIAIYVTWCNIIARVRPTCMMRVLIYYFILYAVKSAVQAQYMRTKLYLINFSFAFIMERPSLLTGSRTENNMFPTLFKETVDFHSRNLNTFITK